MKPTEPTPEEAMNTTVDDAMKEVTSYSSKARQSLGRMAEAAAGARTVRDKAPQGKGPHRTPGDTGAFAASK